MNFHSLKHDLEHIASFVKNVNLDGKETEIVLKQSTESLLAKLIQKVENAIAANSNGNVNSITTKLASISDKEIDSLITDISKVEFTNRIESHKYTYFVYFVLNFNLITVQIK